MSKDFRVALIRFLRIFSGTGLLRVSEEGEAPAETQRQSSAGAPPSPFRGSDFLQVPYRGGHGVGHAGTRTLISQGTVTARRRFSIAGSVVQSTANRLTTTSTGLRQGILTTYSFSSGTAS